MLVQGARKLSFKEFEKALQAIAEEKKVSLEAVQRQICVSGGPQRSHTTPTNHVRLHDDKSSYTGTPSMGLSGEKLEVAHAGKAVAIGLQICECE